ncbi:hypothetical protein QUB49_20090 [Microcoleus sp. AT9_B4]
MLTQLGWELIVSLGGIFDILLIHKINLMPERLFLGIPNGFMLSNTEFPIFLFIIFSDDRL